MASSKLPSSQKHLSFLLILILVSLLAITLIDSLQQITLLKGNSGVFYPSPSQAAGPTSTPLKGNSGVFYPSPSQSSSTNFTPLKGNSGVFYPSPSQASSTNFSIRAEKFFDEFCDIRFFMTWISAAESVGQRELLAMESVFKFHPRGCLMIVSSSMDSPEGERMLSPLVEKGFHVAAMSPDFSYLFNDTPAEAWYTRLLHGDVDHGTVPLGQNLSNLLRLAILYKFGGIYLDTDIIVLKNLSSLHNAIGAQSAGENGKWSRLNNAVLIFGKGHPVLYKFMEEFAQTFDGYKWGYNGPYLVSRVVSRLIEGGGGGLDFMVLPLSAFYPVGWMSIGGLFRGPSDRRHSRWIELKVRRLRHESYVLHLWNKQSRGIRVEEGSVIQSIIGNSCVLCNYTLSSF